MHWIRNLHRQLFSRRLGHTRLYTLRRRVHLMRLDRMHSQSRRHPAVPSNAHIKTAQQRTTSRAYYTAMRRLVHWPLVGALLHLVQRWEAWAAAPPSPLLAVPNLTAHPSTASVPTSYYLMWHYKCHWALKGIVMCKCDVLLCICSPRSNDNIVGSVLSQSTIIYSSWLLLRVTYITGNDIRSSAVAQKSRDVRATEYFAKTLKVTQDHSKRHLSRACVSLYQYSIVTVCISYRFWDIQHQIMAWPWNGG